MGTDHGAAPHRRCRRAGAHGPRRPPVPMACHPERQRPMGWPEWRTQGQRQQQERPRWRKQLARREQVSGKPRPGRPDLPPSRNKARAPPGPPSPKPARVRPRGGHRQAPTRSAPTGQLPEPRPRGLSTGLSSPVPDEEDPGPPPPQGIDRRNTAAPLSPLHSGYMPRACKTHRVSSSRVHQQSISANLAGVPAKGWLADELIAPTSRSAEPLGASLDRLQSCAAVTHVPAVTSARVRARQNDGKVEARMRQHPIRTVVDTATSMIPLRPASPDLAGSDVEVENQL